VTAPFEALPAATRDSLLVGYLSAAWSRSPQRLDDYPDIAMLEATDHAAWTDGQSLRHAAHMVWTADGSGDYYRDCAAYDAIATRLNATYADRMVILTTDPDRHRPRPPRLLLGTARVPHRALPPRDTLREPGSGRTHRLPRARERSRRTGPT